MAQTSADHERAPGGSGRTGRRGSGGRYGLLLLVLIVTYLLSAFVQGRIISDLQLLLFLALLLLALRTSRVRGRREWLAAGVALAGSAAALGAALTGTEVGDGVAALWKGLILLLTVVLILSRVLAKEGAPTVRVETAGETRVARLLWATMLGDLVSLELAKARGVDPLPVEAIERFKEAMGPV